MWLDSSLNQSEDLVNFRSDLLSLSCNFYDVPGWIFLFVNPGIHQSQLLGLLDARIQLVHRDIRLVQYLGQGLLLPARNVDQ